MNSVMRTLVIELAVVAVVAVATEIARRYSQNIVENK